MNPQRKTDLTIKRQIDLRSAPTDLTFRTLQHDPTFDEITRHHADGSRCHTAQFGDFSA
ncbi:hypothetical protein D3C71_1989770 [compost metagenome]